MVSEITLRSTFEHRPQYECLRRFGKMYNTLDAEIFLPDITSECMFINQKLRFFIQGEAVGEMLRERMEELRDEPMVTRPMLAVAMVDGFFGPEICLACYKFNREQPNSLITIEMDGSELSIITFCEILPLPSTADVTSYFPGLTDEEAAQRLAIKDKKPLL